MPKNADVIFQDNKFLVTGDLNIANVMSVYQKSLAQLAKCHEYIFDFSQLHACDSAALALIVEWIKHAEATNKQIRFVHISSDIMSIAKAAGMDEIIQQA